MMSVSVEDKAGRAQCDWPCLLLSIQSNVEILKAKSERWKCDEKV